MNITAILHHAVHVIYLYHVQQYMNIEKFVKIYYNSCSVHVYIF